MFFIASVNDPDQSILNNNSTNNILIEDITNEHAKKMILINKLIVFSWVYNVNI